MNGALAVPSAGIVVLLLVCVVAVRENTLHTAYGSTDLAAWRKEAWHLRWRDRWRVYRANARGGQAPPGLTGVAVRRGEVQLSVTEIALARLPGRRRTTIFGALWLLLSATALVMTVWGGRDPLVWLTEAILSGFAGTSLLRARNKLQRRQRLLRRSVELNRPARATDA